MTDEEQGGQWQGLAKIWLERFGQALRMESALFIVGIQEFPNDPYADKAEKEDLIHLAAYFLLAQAGYYQITEEGTERQFIALRKYEDKSDLEQEQILKGCILAYFSEKGII